MFRDFSRFYNPLHGNCYVYNSGWNSSVKLKTSTRSGRLHGQKITIQYSLILVGHLLLMPAEYV